VPFGPSGPPQPDYIESFSVFKKKYLSAGDPEEKVAMAKGIDFLQLTNVTEVIELSLER